MHTLDPPDHRVTPEEYLAFERGSLHNRHEYRNGRIIRHWGGNVWHASITTDLIAIIGNQLKAEDFEPFAVNMRIKVEATGLYTYPDFLITPRDPKCEDQERDTLLNPLVIGEVLSKTSEVYDRGEKFAHYRELPSLQEYFLVSQDKPLVERTSAILLTVGFSTTPSVSTPNSPSTPPPSP